MDANGVAVILGALAALVVAITPLYVQFMTFKKDQKAQNEKLQATMDGSLTKMLDLIKKGAAAEAILENDKLQAVLQAAVDKAVSKERETGRQIARALAAPSPHPEIPTDVRIVGQDEPVPVVVKDKG